jgi:uncharacterized protein YndB with AHSA1/START domain
MSNKLITEVSVTINAATNKVWKAITTPETIKKYLYGTRVTTDWKVGSAINYEGEYNGKKYNDKGLIQKLEPGKIFQSTYWSSMGGKEDTPENYNVVTYKLTENEGKTTVTLTQDNIETEEEKRHATDNWKGVLRKLKEVVEGV